MLVESLFLKIRIFVPVEDAVAVREAMHAAGAGVLGNYDFCSASWKVTGRYRPLAGSNPTIGKIGEKIELTEEIIETLCHRDLVEAVILAVKKVHPYEEPAIDIMPRLEIE